MKLFRKMLLVVLFMGIMLPAYSAPEKEKKEKKQTDIKCPECGRKVDLERELKKLEKANKKKNKKKKKKDKKKDKGKDKDKNKDNKEDKGKKDAAIKAIKCPKCKKNIPLTQPENDKKAGKADAGKADAENAEAPKDENSEAETKDNE